MDIEQLMLTCVGVEDDGERIKLYVAGPTPKPSTSRGPGRRTSLFHLFAGDQAETIRAWLTTRKAWQVLRVPPKETANPERTNP